jgi:translation initiation factor 1
MARKDRIEINSDDQPELNNPFANLQIDNLPLGETIKESPAAPTKSKPAKLGRVVLRRETAHRGGKTVVVVYDFASSISLRQIEELARKLRSGCGCGGTTKERTIEIQGEQVAKIRALLEQEGFRVAGVR